MNIDLTVTSRRSWIVMAITAASLTGCAAGLDGDYACDKVGGINGCTDMMEVRHLTDTGVFNQPQATSPAVQAFSNAQRAQPSMAVRLSGGARLPVDAMDFIPLPRRDRHGFPLRTSDSVQKITIFPFINAHGDYIDTTDVYIVLDKSHWTGRPVQYIRGD